MDKERRMLNFLQACEYLNLRPSELYKLIIRKQIPYFAPTKRIYLNTKKINEWKQSKKN